MPSTQCPKCGGAVEYHPAQLQSGKIHCIHCKSILKASHIEVEEKKGGNAKTLLIAGGVIFGVLGVAAAMLVLTNMKTPENLTAKAASLPFEEKNKNNSVKNPDQKTDPAIEPRTFVDFQSVCVLRMIGRDFKHRGDSLYMDYATSYMSGINNCEGELIEFGFAEMTGTVRVRLDRNSDPDSDTPCVNFILVDPDLSLIHI